MKNKYAYYPGCSLHSTAFEYDRSFKAVCAELGLDLEEVKDWTCCGASSAHPVSRLLSVTLPLSTMLKAQDSGAGEMLVPCAACFSRLKTAEHEVKNSETMRKQAEKVLEKKLDLKIKITHPLELIEKLLTEKPLTPKKKVGLKAACYYGCLLTRPPKVTQFDVCEYPMSMDNVLRKSGVTTIDWSFKTDCCGASFGLSKPEMVVKLTQKILENAIELGADAIAVACPLCHANLDSRQGEMTLKREIPIFYFTQLMGLAMGLEPEKLAVASHLTDTARALESIK